MISIDDHQPPDPNSSSDYQNHHQPQVSHEASVSDIDLLKLLTDANLDDTNNPLPRFSIRDYVFAARSKDITCNWPFTRESLQLCLHYGVKNFLPPFESLDLLRSNSYTSRSTVENRLPNEEKVINFDGKSTDDQFVSFSSCSILEEDLAHTKSKKSTTKKCKNVMKLNSGVESVEETMASKVCPVCKTFSSSSNTKLNAHIDRCLSEESSMKWAANPKNITVKHRIKPRKTRLMVDMYETAPRCTVEELDRRNGTNWATNSNFHDQELEFDQAEEKNKDPQELTFVPEVADHEGAVYIDTNGTKVRILSMPEVNTLDDQVARKLQKGGKGSKTVMEKKKKKAYGQKNHQKILKLSADNKNFRVLKPNRGASEVISNDQEESFAIEESCNKEDRDEKPMKARVYKQKDDLAFRKPPWVCSKQSGLKKKLNGAQKNLGEDKSDKSSSENTSSSQSIKKVRTSSLYNDRPLSSLVKSSSKKTFPMLAKQKDSSLLRDSCEDPLVTRSNSNKFSSFKENLSSSASHESNAESEVYLKRKFSALIEPSEESLKEYSRMEEDTSEKLSFEIENVVEVSSKKSNEDSFGGLDVTLQSSRTIVPSRSNHVVTTVHGSFMGLRNSFDDEFFKVASQLDNRFDLHDEDHMHDTENQESYFHEIDPIPIPGPPGSFLPPSPGGGDMVSEELQDNSSLTTTSRVQSSEHHLHHDHDTMNKEYPISDSPISTISSPTFARSSSRNTVAKKPIDAIFTEKGLIIPSTFQNEEPCCCPEIPASYHQESWVSRERNLELNMKPSSMNFRSEFFPLINHTTLPAPPQPLLPPPEPIGEPPVVSPSTPVLRLMGKNLTVVKTDDIDVFKPPSHIDQQQLHNIRNNNHNSYFYGYPPQYSITFSHNQNNSRSLADLRPVHALDSMFPNTINSYTAPADYHRFDHMKMSSGSNADNAPAAKEMIIIDDSSENEADDSYGGGGVSTVLHNGGIQTLSWNDPTRSSSHVYYHRNFDDQELQEKMEFKVLQMSF